MDSMHADYHELGWLIQTVRQQAGLSRRELAKAVGVRDRWIKRLELGDEATQNAQTLGEITTTLQLDPVAVDWLSGGQLEGWFPGLETWFRPAQLSAAAALAARRLAVRRQRALSCGLAATGGL